MTEGELPPIRGRGRWALQLRRAALALCVTGALLLLAVLILPWPLGEGSLRTLIPMVYAFQTPAVVLLAAGLSLTFGLIIVTAFRRSAATEATPPARWAVAWLCLSGLVFLVVDAMGYDRFAFVPAFATAGFLPALTCRSTPARIAWTVVAAALGWWSISLASAPMMGGEKFAGVGVIIGLVALAALQSAFAVAGLLRAAYRS